MQTERFFKDIFGPETGDEIRHYFTHDELVSISQKMIELLYPEEIVILRAYYGIYDASRTIKEIARDYHRSPSTISKIRQRALTKLRHQTRSHHILLPLQKRKILAESD